MELTEITAMLPTAGVIITLGTAYLTIRKIARDAKKEKKEQAAEILQTAKEEVAKAKASINADRALIQKDFEARLGNLEQEFQAHKDSVDKDFAHVRETYNSEIRNLGNKIEELREELRSQNNQMIGLLSKLIDGK